MEPTDDASGLAEAEMPKERRNLKKDVRAKLILEQMYALYHSMLKSGHGRQNLEIYPKPTQKRFTLGPVREKPKSSHVEQAWWLGSHEYTNDDKLELHIASSGRLYAGITRYGLHVYHVELSVESLRGFSDEDLVRIEEILELSPCDESETLMLSAPRNKLTVPLGR